MRPNENRLALCLLALFPGRGFQNQLAESLPNVGIIGHLVGERTALSQGVGHSPGAFEAFDQGRAQVAATRRDGDQLPVPRDRVVHLSRPEEGTC